MEGLLLPGLLVLQGVLADSTPCSTTLAAAAAFWCVRDFMAWRRLRHAQ